jgi:hypothetical protein
MPPLELAICLVGAKRPEGVRGVLDHRDVAAGDQLADRLEVGRRAGVVHRDDRAGARAQQRRHGLGGERQRRRIDVGEHRLGAAVDRADRGRDVGEGRHDDLVARADA